MNSCDHFLRLFSQFWIIGDQYCDEKRAKKQRCCFVISLAPIFACSCPIPLFENEDHCLNFQLKAKKIHLCDIISEKKNDNRSFPWKLNKTPLREATRAVQNILFDTGCLSFLIFIYELMYLIFKEFENKMQHFE